MQYQGEIGAIFQKFHKLLAARDINREQFLQAESCLLAKHRPERGMRRRRF